LNQLLVVMDGIDNPVPAGDDKPHQHVPRRRIFPRRLGKIPLRLPPRPARRPDRFISATNVPIDRLDPADPARADGSLWFRTPTKQDRLDVFDLYHARGA
jgi:hypothetical protein